MRVWHSLRSGRSVSRRRWPSVGRWVSFFSFSLRLACFIYFLSCCWCGRVEAAVNWLGHAHSSNTKNKKIPRKQKVFFSSRIKRETKECQSPERARREVIQIFFNWKPKSFSLVSVVSQSTASIWKIHLSLNQFGSEVARVFITIWPCCSRESISAACAH